ncbi:MAG: hypothetical protein HQK83_05185 [Fibrobacteria bacterium]|nr:hypothetical protein [Fibrobacteria bacterium]
MTKLKTLTTLLSSALIILTSCVTNESEENYNLVSGLENNSGTDVAKEVAQMSQAFEFKDFANTPSAKVSAVSEAQANELNLSVKPWAYSEGWWKRSGEITASDDNGSNGFLKGSDDVQFANAKSEVVQFPVLENATGGTIKHEAQLYLEGPRGAYWDIGREFNLTGVVTESNGDSILTISGDLSQYFKAENAAKTQEIHVKGEATATNVKWVRGEATWGTPVSGTVNMESNFRIIDIEFEPGVAHVKVTGKTDNFSKSYDVVITDTTP